MASQVQVHDVSELRSYGQQLAGLREELLSAASQLARLADDMNNAAGSMKSATEGQGSNWSDPQYESLKGDVIPVAESVDSTAQSMTDTASLINAKMEDVQDSIDYISVLVAKLEDV
jgi:uncharacterized protein Yka (UPF0111/DUF47 family)